MRRIDEIILHCTDTPNNTSVESIKKYHLSLGWSDIGYHYLIHANGAIEVGRGLSVVGAHCKGHNAHSIGIAYIGRRPTKIQIETLRNLCINLKKVYPTITKITRHCDYNSAKTCPNLFKHEYEYITKDIL